MYLNLSHLDLFRDVARSGNISLTAQERFITQPALSKVIVKLEDELGVKLFDRSSKSIILNSYGEIVLQHADRIFAELGDLEKRLGEMKSGSGGTLFIGSSFPTREPGSIVNELEKFMTANRNVSLHLLQMSPEALDAALLNRMVDLALCPEAPAREELEWIHLFTEEMGIIMAEGHPLAKKERISLSSLRDEYFLCTDSNSDNLHLTQRFCRTAGFEPHIRIRCDLPMFLGRFVGLGYGVSLIAAPQYRHQSHPVNDWEERVVFRPLAEEYCVRRCGVANLKKHYMPQVAYNFKKQLLEHFAANNGKSDIL